MSILGAVNAGLGKVRVPDSLRLGIRRNGPPGGWLTDESNWRRWGSYSQDSPSPLPDASWWVASDGFAASDWGLDAWGGPGDWSTQRAGVLPAVTRCQLVITNSVCRTPWAMRRGGENLHLPLWVRDPMLLGGGPGTLRALAPVRERLPGVAFWATVLSHMLLWGRSAIVFAEGEAGQPVPGTLRILNPFAIEPDRDVWGSLDAGGWVIDPGGGDPLTTDRDGRFWVGGIGHRLCVLRGMPPNDDAMPEGVLLRHWDTLRLGAAITGYVAGTLDSGVPSGFLKVATPNFGEHEDPVTGESEAETLKRKWLEHHGVGRRGIAVLNASVDFQPISIKPTDAQADDLTHLSRSDIALAFNLDPVVVGEGASGLTYNNQSDRREDLVDLTTSAWGALLLDTLSGLLPHGQQLSVEWPRFTQANFESRAPVVVQAMQAGLISRAEGRSMLAMEPEMEQEVVPGGDGADGSQ